MTDAVGPEGHRSKLANVDGLAWSLVAIGFVAGVLVRLQLSRHYEFGGDDWLLTYQGLTPRGFIEPYNGHLSIVSIALYRISAELFGINNILPLRVFAEAAYCAVAVFVFVHVKERAGLWLALPITAALLFYPDTVVAMSAFNHFLGVLGILAVAWLLPREGSRIDWAVVALLCFALASSGVAVAGAVGCVVFVALAKVTWRRRAAVAFPVALWAVWYFVFAPAGDSRGRAGIGTILGHVWRGMVSSQRGLVFDNRLLGAVLGITMVVLLALRLAHGLRHAAFSLSWFIAACAWWVGLSQARVYAQNPELMFRYRFVGSVLIALALLPRRRSDHVSRLMERTRRLACRTQPIMAVLALLVVVFSVAAPIVNSADPRLNDGPARQAVQKQYRTQEAAANLGPSYVADNILITGPYFYMSVGQYRKVVRAFGAPSGTQPKNFDEFIIHTDPMKLQSVAIPDPPICEKTDQPVSVENDMLVFLVTRKKPVAVRARLVGTSWTKIGILGPLRRGSVVIPDLFVDRKWEILAPGACVIVKHRLR